MEVLFLTVEEVVEIHRDQIARYGGRPGVRDLTLLESAAAMPAATFRGRFLHRDLANMAAAYLFHLVADHPFVDGNKRVGAVAAVVFLALNGIRFAAPEDEYESVVMGVAKGKIRKPEVTAFFKKYVNR